MNVNLFLEVSKKSFKIGNAVSSQSLVAVGEFFRRKAEYFPEFLVEQLETAMKDGIAR